MVSRNTITKLSTSLGEICQNIRLHYGFQTSGSHFIDLACISQGADERHEDLYQRLLAFVDDNLLRPEFGIAHHGVVPTEEEELSPTLENFITLRWLQLLHPDLPALVKQRYGPELRSRTLASLKPEISQALDSLLGELRSAEDAKVLRAAAESVRGSARHGRMHGSPRGSSHFQPVKKTAPRPSRDISRPEDRQASRSCALCKAAGRPGSSTHFLSRCRFLPEADRRFMTGVRLIIGCSETEDDVTLPDTDEPGNTDDVTLPVDSLKVSDTDPMSDIPVHSRPDSIRRVQTSQPPHLLAFFDHHPVRLTLDSGAEVNLIRSSLTRELGVVVRKTSQTAL